MKRTMGWTVMQSSLGIIGSYTTIAGKIRQYSVNERIALIKSQKFVPVLCRLISTYRSPWCLEDQTLREHPALFPEAIRVFMDIVEHDSKSIHSEVMHPAVETLMDTKGALEAIRSRYNSDIERIVFVSCVADSSSSVRLTKDHVDEYSDCHSECYEYSDLCFDEAIICREMLQFLKEHVYCRIRSITFHQFRRRDYQHGPFPYNRWNRSSLPVPDWFASTKAEFTHIMHEHHDIYSDEFDSDGFNPNEIYDSSEEEAADVVEIEVPPWPHEVFAREE